ncbi:MBL fold metallo-hydrolase [Nocardioides korecus]
MPSPTSSSTPGHGPGTTPRFVEVADRVLVARVDWFDVNVTVVAGSEGLLVVDTHASPRVAREVAQEARRLLGAPLLGIVQTHVHFDHTLGTRAVLDVLGLAPVVSHDAAAAALPAHAAQVRASAAADPDERMHELADVAEVVADRTFSSVTTVDLGDRVVELVHPGRGHTDGDVVLRVEDADVLLAGDLVEESGTPAWGEDCWPMEWPLSLDLVLELVGPATVVVPGHGAPVGKDYMYEQRAAIGVVAETVRDLAGRGIPVSRALEEGQWPYPREALAHAVRRGYEQLPRSQKRLPLI